MAPEQKSQPKPQNGVGGWGEKATLVNVTTLLTASAQAPRGNLFLGGGCGPGRNGAIKQGQGQQGKTCLAVNETWSSALGYHKVYHTYWIAILLLTFQTGIVYGVYGCNKCLRASGQACAKVCTNRVKIKQSRNEGLDSPKWSSLVRIPGYSSPDNTTGCAFYIPNSKLD